MKKITTIFLVTAMLFGIMPAYAANEWLYEGADCIIKNYDDKQTFAKDMKAEPAHAFSGVSWVSGENSGNGTGAVQFAAQDYAYESPSYYISPIEGRTYKFSMDVKPVVDFVTDKFSLWLSSKKDDGTNTYLSIVECVEDIDFKKNQWTNVSGYFTWDGMINGEKVKSENVSVKFQIGTAGIGSFSEATGSSDIPIQYCFDNFELCPYIPDLKVKVMGNYDAGETVLVKCSYDFLDENLYSEFLGFDKAVINVLADDKIIKEVTAKETVVELTDEYIGKKISYEISPVVYGKQLETVKIDAESVKRKNNSFKVNFDNKLIAGDDDVVTGRVEQNIYDDTNTYVYIASYKNGVLQNVITPKEEKFSVSSEGVNEVRGYIWDEDMTPLSTEVSIAEEQNSIAVFVDSQNGSDDNDGKVNTPFRTVKRAKEEAAKLIAEHSNQTNIRWNYENSVLTVSGKGKMPDYEVGSAPWEKHRNEIRTLVIEDGVTGIGANAFYGYNNIKNAIMPKTLTGIGANAFSGCNKLSAVVLPDSVTTVETGAFGEATAACVSKTSSFANADGFKTYTAGAVGDVAINISGRKTVSWAVYGEDTLVFSGTGAMKNDYSNVSNIPWNAYSKTLETAVVDYGITMITQGLLTSDKGTTYPAMQTVIIADSVIQMRNNEVAGCTDLKRYDSSNTVTEIEHWVMNGTGIEELYLPGTLKKRSGLGVNFGSLGNLKILILDEGFDALQTDASGEWYSFIREAGQLKSITFPKSVTRVGEYSFSRISRLEKIEFLNPNTVISDNAFYICGENITVRGYKGSTAEAFAAKKGYKFEEITSSFALTKDSDEISSQGTIGIDKIYIMLKSGEHFIDETLNFDFTDCSETIDVIYTTYGGGKAVLTGGVKLDNSKWETADLQKGIYKNYVGTELKSRQFFVDGVRANRARSNGGFTNYEVDTNGYLCDDEELLEFAHPEDLEILIHVAWTTPRCGVEQITRENGKVRVKMKEKAWNILWGRSQESFQQCRPNNPYYYENAYELLDEEGEWYLNSHDGYLYYKPRAFEDLKTAEAVIPVTEKLIHIEGTKTLGVQNITFDNLEFAYTTWMRPSTDAGHCSNQNNTIWDGDIDDMDKIYYPDGAIEVKCADNIDFTNCTFTKLGTIALKVYGGIHNIDIVGNEFYDLSAAAIVVSERFAEAQTTADDRYVNRDIKISNNLIHSIGNDFHDSAALTTGYVMNTEISNNEIFNTPYSAMHLGFVKNENYISGLLIEGNYVHDYMKKMTDGGGIYLFSNTAGSESNPNIIRRNYVGRGWHGVTAFCIDYDVSDVTFENNVNDSVNNRNNLDDYATEWSKGWIPRDFGIGETNRNLTFINNFGTNGYKVSENAQNCTVKNHTVSEFGVWNDTAKDIIRNSGVLDEYLSEMTDFPREIETAGSIELCVGDEQKISFNAYDENENLYTAPIECYYYSLNDNIVSIKENNVLVAKACGEATVKAVFRCGTVLRERMITVTVK